MALSSRKPHTTVAYLVLQAIWQLLDKLPSVGRLGCSDHIMLGTDYPYDMGESDPVGLVNRTPKLTAQDRARIRGLNAARLLGIEVKQPIAATPARKKASPPRKTAARKRGHVR